jgi:hypothetical protein
MLPEVFNARAIIPPACFHVKYIVGSYFLRPWQVNPPDAARGAHNF